MSEVRLTRKQALEKGKQKDVSDTAKEVGLYFTVFVTDTVWNDWITPDQESRDSGQDEKQGLKNLITRLMYAIKTHRQTGGKSDIIFFNAMFTKNSKPESVQLVSQIAVIDSDDPKPCITVMTQEDYLSKIAEGA